MGKKTPAIVIFKQTEITYLRHNVDLGSANCLCSVVKTRRAYMEKMYSDKRQNKHNIELQQKPLSLEAVTTLHSYLFLG